MIKNDKKDSLKYKNRGYTYYNKPVHTCTHSTCFKSTVGLPVPSVATAIADVFRKNAISVGSKFTKMLKIFDKIDEMKSRRVI